MNVCAVRLAELFAERLEYAPFKTDGLAQDVRIARDLGAPLVHCLSEQPKRTWLLVDGINHINLDESALELLRRLCLAIDGGECPNVSLFLVGLDPAVLGSQFTRFMLIDRVGRPQRQDIEDYLKAFADSVGTPRPPVEFAKVAGELDGLLPAAPDHVHWHEFHEALATKCAEIGKERAS